MPSIQKAPLYTQTLPAPYESIECPDEQTAVQLIRLKRRPIIHSKENNDFAYRTWHIHPQLEKLGRCNTGCALDLGCGNGRDSIWLACNGWSVTAVDHLPEIQRSIDEFSSRFQVTDRIHFVHSYIHELTTNNRFQLVLLHYTWKDSNLQRALEHVEVGGSISVLVHSETHYRCFGSPQFPQPPQPPENFRVFSDQESWLMDRHVRGFVWQRIQE